MTDRDDHAARLRDGAAWLLTVALQAREDGNGQYAEELTRLASEAIDQATDLESRVAQVARATRHVAQRTQQPQLAHGRKPVASLDRTETTFWHADRSFRWGGALFLTGQPCVAAAFTSGNCVFVGRNNLHVFRLMCQRRAPGKAPHEQE